MLWRTHWGLPAEVCRACLGSISRSRFRLHGVRIPSCLAATALTFHVWYALLITRLLGELGGAAVVPHLVYGPRGPCFYRTTNASLVNFNPMTA